MMPPSCVVFQSLLNPIWALLELNIPRVGLRSASVIPKRMSDGPIARTRIFLVEPAGPWTMNPSIKALSPVPAGSRVETLPTRPGVEVAVGVPVAVAVGLAVAVAVAVAVGLAVPVAVGVAVAVAVGLAVAV